MMISIMHNYKPLHQRTDPSAPQNLQLHLQNPSTTLTYLKPANPNRVSVFRTYKRDRLYWQHIVTWKHLIELCVDPEFKTVWSVTVTLLVEKFIVGIELFSIEQVNKSFLHTKFSVQYWSWIQSVLAKLFWHLDWVFKNSHSAIFN